MGDYVYGKRHNRELETRSKIGKVMDHVRVGATIE
jgi:hypothetical protein